MIKIVKQKDNSRYSVLTEPTNRLIGIIDENEEGFYYFMASTKYKYWSSNSLKQIVNKLDELNKPPEEKIKKFFENEIQ